MQTAIALPLSLYSTFVIEERHGFNRQTLRLFLIDTVKSLLLTSIFFAPLLIAVFLGVIRNVGKCLLLMS